MQLYLLAVSLHLVCLMTSILYFLSDESPKTESGDMSQKVEDKEKTKPKVMFLEKPTVHYSVH